MEEDQAFSIYVVAATVVVAAVLLLFLWQGSPAKKLFSKGDAVLLIGPCGGGKTALFHKLVHGEMVETITSMKMEEWEGEVCTSDDRASNKIRLIDFPGHPRLRTNLQDMLPHAAKLVYMVDITKASLNIRAIAEFLFNVLSSSAVNRNKPPLLFVCNKIDEDGTKSAKRLKDLIEKELNKLKITQTSLQEVGEDGPSQVLGREDQKFEFSVDSPCKVHFVECSVKANKLGPVYDFLL